MCEDILAQYMEGKRPDGWERLSCYTLFVCCMDVQKTGGIRSTGCFDGFPALSYGSSCLCFPPPAVASWDLDDLIVLK